MIHYIITGHGEFSTGLLNALEMIAGKQENLTIIPFKEGDALEAYQANLAERLENNPSGEGHIFFTDLLGGTPYKTCVSLSLMKENCYVLSGTNLGMFLEGVALRTFMDDPKTLCETIKGSGKDNIEYFTKPMIEEEVAI